MSAITGPGGVPPAAGTAGEEHVELDVHWGKHRPWEKTDIAATPGGAVTASKKLLTGDISVLHGWAVAETTNAAGANFRIHDGNDANGEVLARVNLAINESNRETFSNHGLRVHTGHLYIEVLSGSIEGVVYWS